MSESIEVPVGAIALGDQEPIKRHVTCAARFHCIRKPAKRAREPLFTPELMMDDGVAGEDREALHAVGGEGLHRERRETAQTPSFP